MAKINKIQDLIDSLENLKKEVGNVDIIKTKSTGSWSEIELHINTQDLEVQTNQSTGNKKVLFKFN
jgi:conjugal transfer/entry exclusion protein